MVYLDYSIVLVIGEMEVDSSQYLSELFGSDLLVGVSVPVLEETLYVQSGIKYPNLVETQKEWNLCYSFSTTLI